MEKKLFDLIAAALSALTLLTAWGIWLDDRRKKRKDNAPYPVNQSATNIAQGTTNMDMQKDIDDLRQEVDELRREGEANKRMITRLGDAVKKHRTKILELLDKLSDNTF